MSQSPKLTRWENIFAPIPNEWLVIYRLAFGAVMAYYAIYSLISGRVDLFYVIPLHHFPYDGFAWISKLDFWMSPSVHAMHVEYSAMAILAILILLGAFYRVSATLFALVFCHVFLIDKCYYQNHYYLISLLSLIMPFLPAHRSCSVDVILRRVRRSRTTPRWTLWLIRFMIGIPYLYGGIAKLSPDWVRGQPMRLAMADKVDIPLFGEFVTQEWFVQTLVWGGLLFDLMVVPALLYRRTRVLAFLLCLVFHLTNSQVWTIGVFPWLMMAATTVFFEPDWPRRVVQRFGQRFDDTCSKAQEALPTPIVRWTTLGILFVFVSWQVMFPLRHFILPDNPNWDEYTHHFSWHMLLRGKKCGLRVVATDPSTGRSGTVDLRMYVTARQLAVVVRDPRMIHQLTHYIARNLRDRGYPRLEIRVLSLVSLNGRQPQLMIDPHVDLISRRLGGYPDFVVPLRQPLRYSAWDYPLAEWEQRLELELPSQMQFPTREVSQSSVVNDEPN
ncbi:MAG: HTTM domain-containing protein [Planctomycetaceae bacterium]|nr:HTTM domain-containing protein [Planctomycetaceae bacterium]